MVNQLKDIKIDKIKIMAYYIATVKVQDVEVLRRDVEYTNQDLISRIDGWVSSTDSRFDKLYDEVGRLDSVVNPNKDLLKG